MADKSQVLLLEALARLAAAPDGLPLVSGKGSVGICAATAAGKQAAELIKSEAYAHVIRQESKQKSVHDIYALSEKGVAFLLEQTSPRLVLEALVRPILTYLKRRQDAGALADCPLPEMYRHIQSSCPSLTVGQYHDLLRRLHAEAALYLHPWTGPLYEMPEPALALLVGHEVAYYASLRMQEPLAA